MCTVRLGLDLGLVFVFLVRAMVGLWTPPAQFDSIYHIN